VGRKSGSSAQKSFVVQTNWTQFRYGPKHQGYSPYEKLLSTSTVAGLNQAWRYDTGDSVIASSPAVAGGAVYFGCYDGKLYALNASTGAVRWDYTTGGLIQSCPAVAGGVVYVGSNDGKLYALNASTGAVKWTATTGGDIFTSPAVANGVVYAGSMDGSLYAYSLTPDAVFGILTARPDPARLVPDLSLKPQPR
jgi:outer membrane protein assembly factor BamB